MSLCCCLPLNLCAFMNVDTSSSQGEIYLQVLFRLNFILMCVYMSCLFSPTFILI